MLAESTDRVGRAHVLVYLGGLQALGERFEDSLALLADAEGIYRDLGEIYSLADNCRRIEGRVHLVAGDPQSAERAFREACATFEQVHDEAAISSVAAELGEALYRQERYSESESWARFAEEHAPAGDIAAQFSWRALRGKLIAQEGLVEEGEGLVDEALSIVDGTDALTHRGEVLLDFACVLSFADRYEEAAARIQQALELFALKGNEATARLARAQLDELAVA